MENSLLFFPLHLEKRVDVKNIVIIEVNIFIKYHRTVVEETIYYLNFNVLKIPKSKVVFQENTSSIKKILNFSFPLRFVFGTIYITRNSF